METIHGLRVNGPAIIGTGVTFTVLAVTAVALRFGSKRIAHNPFGVDDWLLLFALLCYFTAEVLVIRCWYSKALVAAMSCTKSQLPSSRCHRTRSELDRRWPLSRLFESL